MSDILVIGSSNTDMVVKTARFPQPGETLIGGTFFMFPGGKGANQAVAAARLGGQVRLIAKVGSDVFGQEALAGFRRENIDTRYCLSDPAAASGVALISVSAEGENQIVVAPGANALLSIADLRHAQQALDEAEWLLMQLEVPLETVAYAARQAARAQKKVILNPAPAQALPDDCLRHLFLITPNESEAELLTGVRVSSLASAALAAQSLLDRGVQHVIITLGARGAFFKSREDQFEVPAQKVDAVDTTAAGDVFNGALAVALAEGQGWREAIAFACKAAAISVTRMGAQSSAPYLHELT